VVANVDVVVWCGTQGRKDVAQIFNNLLRRQIGTRSPTVEHILMRRHILTTLLAGYVILSLCPSVSLCVCLSVCVSLWLAGYVIVSLSVSLFMCLSVWLPVCLSVWLCFCLSFLYSPSPRVDPGATRLSKCLSKLVSDRFMKRHNHNRPSPFPGWMS